jgi:hypothetical protein
MESIRYRMDPPGNRRFETRRRKGTILPDNLPCRLGAKALTLNGVFAASKEKPGALWAPGFLLELTA